MLSFQKAKQYVTDELGYTFQNDDLLCKALHVGVASDVGGQHLPEGNRRLALVGDAVLGIALMLKTYDMDMTTQDANGKRKQLLKNDHFKQIGREYGLDLYITRSRNLTQDERQKAIANTFEALFGAMYLDSGEDLEVVRKGMDRFGLFSELESNEHRRRSERQRLEPRQRSRDHS